MILGRKGKTFVTPQIIGGSIFWLPWWEKVYRNRWWFCWCPKVAAGVFARLDAETVKQVVLIGFETWGLIYWFGCEECEGDGCWWWTNLRKDLYGKIIINNPSIIHHKDCMILGWKKKARSDKCITSVLRVESKAFTSCLFGGMCTSWRRGDEIQERPNSYSEQCCLEMIYGSWSAKCL